MAIPSYRGTIPAAYQPTYNQTYPVEYFSGVDVSLFFGQNYISEIFNFSFTLQETVIPVYGYASYVPKKIIHGSRLVSGEFTINLRSGDYLHELLADYTGQQTTPTTSLLQNSSASLLGSGGAIVATGTSTQPNPSTDPSGFAQWAINQKAINWPAINNATQPTAVIESTPYFTNNNFTILLAYGDLDTIDLTRMNGRVRTIEDVNIFSVGQAIGLDGQNIMETFQFIGTDINQDTRVQGI